MTIVALSSKGPRSRRCAIKAKQEPLSSVLRGLSVIRLHIANPIINVGFRARHSSRGFNVPSR